VKTADPMELLAALVERRDQATELVNALTVERERTDVLVAWARLEHDLDVLAAHYAPTNDEAVDLLAGALMNPSRAGAS